MNRVAEKTILWSEYAIGKARRMYFMALPENEADYQKSRNLYIAGDAAAQTIVQLAGGTFLAGLMSYVGISESNIGIFISLASFAALFQLFMANYLRNLKKCKLFICFTVFMKFLLSFIYFIPLLPIPNSAKATLLILLYFMAQIFMQIGGPAINDWLASLIPANIRGTYLSIKDAFAVFTVATIMLGAGIITDYYKKQDPVTGFVLMGIFLFILVFVNVISLSLMKEPKTSYLDRSGKELHGHKAKSAKEEEKVHLHEQLSLLAECKEAFASKRFRKAFLLNCFYISSFYIAAPFHASYLIQELSLPFTFIMLVGFLCNLYRVAITPSIGKRADKVGMATVLRSALLCLGLSFLVMAFTVPGNARWMYIISTILAASGWTFIGNGLLGVQLEFVDEKKRILQLSLISSISGSYGFFISFLGGKLMDYLFANPLVIAGYTPYPQQVLSVLGFVLIVVTVIYARSLTSTRSSL